MLSLALIVLFAPLAGFLLQSAVGRRLPRQGDFLTVGAIGASLVASVMIALKVSGGETLHVTWPWVQIADRAIDAGIRVDGLTAVMLVVVSLVSFLVHVFSTGYMRGDPKYWKFFAWLQMFSVSMLLLVLSDNLFHLFVGWELVGFCSYKLIGYWSEKQAPCDAARKAFITTRVGDLGMVAALLLLWDGVGSFEFDAIFQAAANGTLSEQVSLWASLGLFAAAMGKSAQFPLHAWLPDAMEGPTPVSALIHAATMVAAGVYLVGRCYPLFPADALTVVATVGAVTALLAGLIALAQNDIKKVLAYSTVSQLGFMFLGLGSGAWHAGFFHLTTHAFFKALMFLASGSVILACHHEQDMRRMGGLWRKMRITGPTFAVGVLAIAGLPFLSGFYSKDAILSGAWNRHPVLFWIGLGCAVLTAFYMFRLFAMTFLGKPKDEHVYEHAHESPPSMTVPLVVLAFLSVVAGYGAWHSTLLDPHAVLDPAGGLNAFLVVGDLHGHEHSSFVMVLAIAAGVSGLSLGAWLFLSDGRALAAAKRLVPGLERACERKFWFDEAYREFLQKPAYAVSRFFAWADGHGIDGAVNGIAHAGRRASDGSGLTDRVVVDGAVNATGWAVLAGGAGVSKTQSGRLRAYIGWGVALTAVVLVVSSPWIRRLF